MPQQNHSVQDLDAFRNRLGKNHRHVSKWARRQAIGCYRLYDRDIPQFPLLIDRYESHVHLQEFDTGWQQSEAEHTAWIAGVTAAAAQVLELPPAHIHYKTRARQRGASQYGRMGSGPEFPVAEGGLRFLVDLDSYLDTGLFLDHRKTRGLVRELSPGRRVLNLFCYTASFSVYAAARGAVTSESVDLSNTYLDWAGRNFRLNEMNLARHALVRADVFAYLRDAQRMSRQFDLIVLDPPSFSNSKKTDEVLDVQRDHGRLIEGAMALLAPGGELLFSTNRRNFALDPEIGARWAVRDITAWSIPEDFRGRPPHACWRIAAQHAS